MKDKYLASYFIILEEILCIKLQTNSSISYSILEIVRLLNISKE